MIAKIIASFILIILVFVLQASFINSLPEYGNNINLGLIILVYAVALVSLRSAVMLACGLGLLFDIFSFSPFGVSIVSFLLTLGLLHILLFRIFTNRSLYTFAISTFIAVIFFNLNYFFLRDIFFGFDLSSLMILSNFTFWRQIAAQVVVNVMAVGIIFYLLVIVNRRFKPVFLDTRNKSPKLY